jgi:hypothetical protein
MHTLIVVHILYEQFMNYVIMVNYTYKPWSLNIKIDRWVKTWYNTMPTLNFSFQLIIPFNPLFPTVSKYNALYYRLIKAQMYRLHRKIEIQMSKNK